MTKCGYEFHGIVGGDTCGNEAVYNISNVRGCEDERACADHVLLMAVHADDVITTHGRLPPTTKGKTS